jgi:hypothetical protein
MPGPTLAELVRVGLLQRKPPDTGRVAGWLDRSRKDLALAKDVLAGVDRDRAMAVAYEAGYRCCAGLLDLAGYRVTSQPGHHRAAIDATTTLLGDAERARLRRLGRLAASATTHSTATSRPQGQASSRSCSAMSPGCSSGSRPNSSARHPRDGRPVARGPGVLRRWCRATSDSAGGLCRPLRRSAPR